MPAISKKLAFESLFAIAIAFAAPVATAENSEILYHAKETPLPPEIQALVVYRPLEDVCEEPRIDKPCKRQFYDDMLPGQPDSMN